MKPVYTIFCQQQRQRRCLYITPRFIWGTVYILVAALLAGCSDFLERSAQNLVIPTTTAQYKELLQGEGYFGSVLKRTESDCGYAFVGYMTDDMEFVDVLAHSLPGLPPSWTTSRTTEDSKVELFANCYRWNAQIEQQQFTDKVYLNLYRQAMVANVCLGGVDASEGSQSEKEVLRGQAAFTRAFAYLMLANLYAKPYNKAAPDDLCVPLKTDPAPSLEQFPRATVSQVWKLITDDLQTALNSLKGKNLERNIYEISYPAALILAIRTALYMEDWDRLVTLGEEFTSSYARYSLSDISAKTTAGPRVDDPITGLFRHVKFINRTNPEIVWVFGSRLDTYEHIFSPNATVDTNGKYICVSSWSNNNLIDCYEPGDRRKDYWFYTPQPESTLPFVRYSYLCAKTDSYVKTDILYGSNTFRTAEVYLALAEAYARRSIPDKGRAIQLLNDLRRKRFDPALYAPLQAGSFTDETLFEYIQLERRRELCCEEMHRWWDLRRYPVQKPIVHRWRNGQTYTLHPNDPAYILNFPEEELTYNGDVLVPNVRPNRTPD
jgi:hypothetical protein